MLETIRQYAREQLIASGEVERLADRHFATSRRLRPRPPSPSCAARRWSTGSIGSMPRSRTSAPRSSGASRPTRTTTIRMATALLDYWIARVAVARQPGARRRRGRGRAADRRRPGRGDARPAHRRGTADGQGGTPLVALRWRHDRDHVGRGGDHARARARLADGDDRRDPRPHDRGDLHADAGGRVRRALGGRSSCARRSTTSSRWHSQAWASRSASARSTRSRRNPSWPSASRRRIAAATRTRSP